MYGYSINTEDTLSTDRLAFYIHDGDKPKCGLSEGKNIQPQVRKMF